MSKCAKGICGKLPPANKENIVFFYVPLQSMISYAALSVNVMNPALIARVVTKKDISSYLLVNTVLGSSLYIYSRPHLKAITAGKRAAYSVLGGALFGLGSVLAWAIGRSAIPKSNSPLATVIGLASGVIIVHLGHSYFNDCDKQTSKS